MVVQEQDCEQISYYTLKDGYIYNIKFGNDGYSTRKNIELIEKIMKSAIIK